MPHVDHHAQQILDEAERAGVSLSTGQATQLVEVLQALNDGPSALTAIRGITEGIPGHVTDSLVGLHVPQIASSHRLVDVGSGSGFPGMALAVALPACEVTLVESVQKKARWLEATAREMLPNVSVLARRSEDVARDHAATFDVVVARALAPPPVALELCAPLAAVGGHVVLWVGPPDSERDARIALAGERLGLAPCDPVAVEPFAGARRRLLPFRKMEPTPDGFPRRPGRANTHPIA